MSDAQAARNAAIGAFLSRHGFGGATREVLAQDASFRRYLRLHDGPRQAVLMDAPPPEDVRPFQRVGAHLAGIGLSVPEIWAADEAAGLLLLEDWGDRLFPQVMGETIQPPLFEAAAEALAIMQEAVPPPSLPAWDADAMAATAAATLLDWWWPAVFGAPAPQDARNDFSTALETMIAPLRGTPPVFVHRDYFAGNLMWLDERDGVRRLGVLDFQSAGLGHPAYDLASLIQDNRRDIPASVAEGTIRRFLRARPALDEAAFRAGLAICAAQRHLRVAGQWVRLAKRDGKPHYLAHGPRTWALLGSALLQPEAAALKAAFDRWVPQDKRGNPAQGFAA